MTNMQFATAGAQYYPPEYTQTNLYNFKAAKSQVIKDLFGSEEICGKAREYIKQKNPELESELKIFEKMYDAAILLDFAS